MQARQRKVINSGTKSHPEIVSNLRNGGSSSSGSTSARHKNQPNAEVSGFLGKYYLGHWKKLFGFCCLLIAVYFGYIGYLETRVNTPFDDTKMVQQAGLNDRERYWGTYRAGTYFGLKTRDPHSIVMGLMWYFPQRIRHSDGGIRHWCDSGDNLDQYGWLQHDGKSFGYQQLHDGPFKLETSFVKFPGGQYGGDWTARVTVKSTDPIYNEVSEIIPSLENS